MSNVFACVFGVLIFVAVLELPVIIAYARGLRGHKLNVILMLISVSVISLGFLLWEIPLGGFIWIAALVMSFVYKPVTAGRLRSGAVERTRRVL